MGHTTHEDPHDGHEERAANDTPEEREAFLKWWEGQAGWTGSPCAVAYQGWLARAAVNDDKLLALGHVERQRDQFAGEVATLRRDLDVQRERSRGLEAENEALRAAATEKIADLCRQLNAVQTPHTDCGGFTDAQRLNWAANELLACDYGDNPGRTVGWVVYGWRDPGIFNQRHEDKRRIYGDSIAAAIDAELRAGGWKDAPPGKDSEPPDFTSDYKARWTAVSILLREARNALFDGNWDRIAVRHLVARIDALDQPEAPADCTAPKVEHVCGLAGYNGMIDPPCPACAVNREMDGK